MTTLDAANSLNVEGTINAAVRAALASITPPSAWLPTTPPLVLIWDDVPASLPCFALAYLGEDQITSFQGQVVGNGKAGRMLLGVAELSAFVTKDNQNWHAQLRTMQAMIQHVVLLNTVMVMQDYTTNPGSPAPTGYKIFLDGIGTASTGPDPNPAIVRSRTLIRYRYVARA